MRFIKVVINICPPPLKPSSHSYILHKYFREISLPKGNLGLGELGEVCVCVYVCVCGGGGGGGGGGVGGGVFL